MANRTAWTAGNGVGFTWTTAINGSDLASLANGSTVLSSVADITNQTASTSTPNFGEDDRDFGDTAGRRVAWDLSRGIARRRRDLWRWLPDFGRQLTRAPPWTPVGSIPLETAIAATNLSGLVQGIIIPPGSFRFALYNGSGAALSWTAGNCIVKYRTYNMQLNN